MKNRDACTGAGRTVIRTTTKTGDWGRGPLELAPVSPAQDIPADCNGDGDPVNDVVVGQRSYNDANGDGIFQRSVDTGSTSHPVGCRYYHAIHKHYHFDSFVRFRLVDAQTGAIVAGNNKVSFCISDSNSFDLSLPGAPNPKYYSSDWCKPRDTVTGISTGWMDTYGWKTPGQEIDITGLPAGDYCVVTEADPENRLAESNETNNVRSVRYRIDPARAPRNSNLTLTPVSGGCPAQLSTATALFASSASADGSTADGSTRGASVRSRLTGSGPRSYVCQLERLAAY